MLVDQDDADVLALRGEALEGGLDGRRLRLVIDDQEVLLRVGRVRDVLDRAREASASIASGRSERGIGVHCQRSAVHPASLFLFAEITRSSTLERMMDR